MEKLMSFFYKLVAIMTILYLMITIYLMSLGDSLITREGWYVIILSSFILVIVFGLEYARRRFPDSVEYDRNALYRLVNVCCPCLWGYCQQSCK